MTGQTKTGQTETGQTELAAAIVLVGGASSRMGTDKASLIVNGKTMVDSVVDAVKGAGITTLVVVGGDELPDDVPGEGPLAGIVGGWIHLKASCAIRPDPVIVLSCDLPSLNAEVLSALLTTSAAHRHGALAHDGERPQPLVGAYRPEALDGFEQAFAAGVRSPRHCFDDWDLGHVMVEPEVVADADTPGDLRGFDVEWPS